MTCFATDDSLQQIAACQHATPIQNMVLGNAKGTTLFQVMQHCKEFWTIVNNSNNNNNSNSNSNNKNTKAVLMFIINGI